MSDAGKSGCDVKEREDVTTPVDERDHRQEEPQMLRGRSENVCREREDRREEKSRLGRVRSADGDRPIGADETPDPRARSRSKDDDSRKRKAK